MTKKIDALERLTKLRDQGALSQDEFEEQKRLVLADENSGGTTDLDQTADKRTTSVWHTVCSIVGIGLIVLALIMWFNYPDMFSSKIPSCDGRTAHNLVKEAIESGGNAVLITPRLFDIQDAKELQFNGRERLCRAKLLTNAGERDQSYVLNRTSKGDLLVTVSDALYIGSVPTVTPVVAPSLAAVPTASPEPSDLLARYSSENELCRGGSGDDAKTWQACDRRDQVGKELTQAGMCYGKVGQDGASSWWHRCEPSSCGIAEC